MQYSQFELSLVQYALIFKNWKSLKTKSHNRLFLAYKLREDRNLYSGQDSHSILLKYQKIRHFLKFSGGVE